MILAAVAIGLVLGNAYPVDPTLAPAIRGEAAQVTATMPAPNTYAHWDPNVERWHATALQVGWPEDQWPWLSCIIHRESRGVPTAYAHDSNDRSYGLVQINARSHHAAMVAYAGSEEAFFDGAVNLGFALQLWQQAGRGPWNGACRG